MGTALTYEDFLAYFQIYENGLAEGWMVKPEVFAERSIGTVEQDPLVYGGMRPQEPPALLCRDVNLSTGDVYIRQSKRHKDRHIIVSNDMLELCVRYDALAGDRHWFFQKWDGGPYTTSWYTQIWRRLWKTAVPTRRGIPRPYNLRHAFASRNIIRWVEAGKDAMELLPYLLAYMGHSELGSTLYYISMLPEKLRRSAKIDWEKLSAVYGEEDSEDENESKGS